MVDVVAGAVLKRFAFYFPSRLLNPFPKTLPNKKEIEKDLPCPVIRVNPVRT